MIAVTDDGLRVLMNGEEITLGELIKEPDRRDRDEVDYAGGYHQTRNRDDGSSLSGFRL